MDNINSDQIKELNEALRALVETFSDLSISMTGATQEAKDASAAASDAAKEAITAEKAAQAFGEKAAGMFGIVKSEGSMFGLIEDLAKVATGAGDASSSMGTASKAFTGMFTKANLLATAFSYLIEAITMMVGATVAMALETDKALTSFNKSTGAAGKYGDMMLSLEAQHRSNQISMEDLGGTFEALSQNFGAFNHMADENQRALAENTAILGELGVSYETTASNLNVLIAGMGMSADAANRVQNEMFYLAQQIGMSPNSMSAAFSEAMPKLAAFGKNAPEVFKKLQVNAQRAGMSMSDILSITEKFDRFDSAAESVGKLNAILGGPYMSVTKMIKTTDPTDRMKILSQATRDAGKSFDSMAYYERKALAAAMGLEDVSQLALVMNNRFDLLAPATQKSAAELEALAEQTAQFNEVGEVISSTLKQIIANFGPMIKGIKSVVGGIGTLIATFPVLKVGIAGIAAAVAAAAIVIMASMSATGVGAIVVGVGVIITALIAAAGALYSFLGTWNELTTQLSGSMGPWGQLMGYLKIAIMLASPLIRAIWVIAQVFTHWEEIMEWVGNNFGDLLAQFSELATRFGAVTSASSSATQSFDVWGNVLKVIATLVRFQLRMWLAVFTAIVHLAEGVRYLWDNYQALRWGIYAIVGVIGLLTAAFILVAAFPALIVIGIIALLDYLGVLEYVLYAIAIAIGVVVLSVLALPIAIVAAIGGIIMFVKYLGDLAYEAFPWVIEGITSFVSWYWKMCDNFRKSFMLFRGVRTFVTALAGPFSSLLPVFQALGELIRFAAEQMGLLADASEKAADTTKNSWDWVKETAQSTAGAAQSGMWEAAKITAAAALVPGGKASLDAGAAIYNSTQSKADSTAMSNGELAASVNKLTASLDKNGPQQVEVVVGTSSKFLTHTQKTINETVKGKPQYTNIG